ncbi:Alcohol dehydrogenase GroES domain protein [Haloterrigena turkmenica DSM 5511]|uniref:Alcohol dehydrogenase GroES domain protein n=1 Tax=Haloterrigena turkmenica (strain ATCC 51198 / DSM 5511 / JCM 9101 / NCIMB 13204 / VKM B-1734 / 4k) TaxID=543526 RepID=D2RXL2_HALTV|nr:zinc-dependent alcohol dehydrogenase family protein [Haloterrigena turkmenica]ADB61736.1 Alcohol dehydrogenase GroES domain protein [Haloterrigena turkmenica DSM 5511]
MRAAVLEAYGEPLSIESVEPPELAPHGVIVDVEACGICRSDWHAWQGHGEWADDQVPLGQILGHEPAGRVARVGDDVETLAVGDRVAVPFNLGEGSCYQCRNGHGNVCEDGYALGFESSVPGAFAEQVHVPHAEFNVTTLPDGVSPEAVAALGCRYVTAFHALAHRADIDAGDWVAVHGCGGLGLAAVQIATALGGRVIAVDVREEPLEMAADLGAEETIDASALEDGENVPDAIDAITDRGAHVSVDALGRAETCRNSVDCLRIRGTHVQIGLTTSAEKGEVALPIDEMTRWDVTVVGSRGMPPSRYDELLRMIEGGRLEPEQLVTRRVGLEDVSDRLAAMSDYETSGVEVVTAFSSSSE